MLLGFCLTFTPKITISLVLSPRSLFAMFGRTGVNPPVTFVPGMKGMAIVLCFSAAVWAGTAVFSVLALALPALRAKSRLCFLLEIGLTILSAALFAVLFVGVYLIVTPIYDFPPSL